MEDEASREEAGFDDDESVSFRCSGLGCVQSPYVGSFDVSNMAEDGTAATSPDGTTTVRITGMSKPGSSLAEMRVTDLAKCEVRRSTTAGWDPCPGTVLDLAITHGNHVADAKIKIESETVDNSGGKLTVYRYNIKGNLDPLTGKPNENFPFPICPADENGERTVVMLPNVQNTWKTTNADDGLGELVTSTGTRFTLACNGYAQAKGYTRGRVLPVTGDTRSYGVSNYNAFTHAMRALYRKDGTTDEYSALTQHGTSIAIKDLRNDPPLFDELDQSPPFIGYGVYLLESVYNAHGNLQLGRKGATCHKPYVRFPCLGEGEAEYPFGIHRRPEHSPPMLAITGWSSMPECDLDHLDDFGSVAVYEYYEGQCVPEY